MAGDKKTEAEKTEPVPKSVTNLERIDKAIETMLESVRSNFKTSEYLEMSEAVLKMSQAKSQLMLLEENGKDKPK